jgi:hypothetical protein
LAGALRTDGWMFVTLTHAKPARYCDEVRTALLVKGGSPESTANVMPDVPSVELAPIIL